MGIKQRKINPPILNNFLTLEIGLFVFLVCWFHCEYKTYPIVDRIKPWRDRIWQYFYYQHQLTMKKRKCLVLDSTPCLFYINYGWRGLIFCFQKRRHSKIFQAIFRAFKVLLLRSFLYKQFSIINFANFFVVFKNKLWNDTLLRKDCVIAFLIFLSKGQTFYLIFRAIISILRKLENKVERFDKLVACLFSMRKSLYSLESPFDL